jgi:RNA polymerase sigma factor (sigma-70 family)
MDASDEQLLQDFVRRKSDEAFNQLFSRYVNLVYRAAIRQVRDPHSAADVTQATFIVLARRAPHISSKYLPGWLLMTARFCARDVLKQQTRRIRHEHEAAMMRPTISQTVDPLETEIAPFLDEAMSRLRDRERTVVTMRFLQNKSLSDVAAAMGTSTNAAQKAVSRSLDKLRQMLLRKGVVLPSTVVLSAVLIQESAHAAPLGLSVPLTHSSVEVFSIAKGAMNIMRWAKIKFAAVITAALLVTGSAGVAVLNRTLAASTDAPAQSQSPQPAISPRDKNLVGFNSPFLELVGCRIKQSLQLQLIPTPQLAPPVTWMEQQYSLVRWSIDPEMAKTVSGYTVSFTLSDDPASVKSFSAPKAATELAQGPTEPGDYLMKVAANDANGKKIAESTARITVKALPMTQIMINDLQLDGSIKFASVFQYLNSTFEELHDGGFMNSNFVDVRKMTDDQGEPLQFTITQRNNMFIYHYNLNTTVQPGQAAMYSSAGTMNGLVRKLNDGLFQYSMDHSPSTSAPVRRIELYRLPTGAKLVSVLPANLPHEMVDGQIQIFVDVMIPTGGSNAVSIRYRLPAQK